MPGSISIGGVEIMADRPLGWVSKPGVTPTHMDFHVTPAEARDLLARRGPLVLSIQKDDGTVDTWTNLYALHDVAGEDPFEAIVRVYDRRWFWKYKHVGPRYFNLRRQVGFYRAEGFDRPELAPVEEDIQYVKSTVDPITGLPYRPADVLRIVVADVARHEAANGGSFFSPVFERGASDEPGTDIVDLIVDEDGDSAISTALAQVPGLAIRVDPSGDVVFYSQTRGPSKGETDDGGDARDVLNSVVPLGEEDVGGGHTIIVSHVNESPREIHFLFTPESELRFDYADPDVDFDFDEEEKDRELKPVLPIPDYQLQVGGKLATQGEYVDTFEYIDALPELPGGGLLTADIVRQALMPFSGIWGAIERLAPLAGSTSREENNNFDDWLSRIAALQRYFLRCFRLPRAWHDRTLAWKASRIATINQSKGSRAPAMVYGGWAGLTGPRAWLRQWNESGGPNLSYPHSRDFYRDELGENSKPSPCLPHIMDGSQGIVFLEYLLDPGRYYEQIMPAQIDTGVYTPGYGPQDEPEGAWHWTFDSIRDSSLPPPKLSSRHKLALILTAIPLGCPSNQNDPHDALYRVRVLPGDIAKGGNGERISEFANRARGPILEVRVHPNIETARLRWVDSRADDYAKLFGVEPGTPNLDGLCMNKDSSSFDRAARFGRGASFGAPLDDIAISGATRIWASYIDHPQGRSTGALDFGSVVRGWTDAVAHTVMPDGAATSTAFFPERITALDWMPLLRPEARGVILKLAYQAR